MQNKEGEPKPDGEESKQIEGDASIDVNNENAVMAEDKNEKGDEVMENLNSPEKNITENATPSTTNTSNAAAPTFGTSEA